MTNALKIKIPVRARKYSLPVLYERHQEIVRLKALGYDSTKIAESLDCSVATVGYTLASPISIKLREEIQTRKNEEVATINDRIADLSDDAVQYMEKILSGEVETASPSLRFKVCESILDRAGHSRITKSQSTNLNAHLTAAEIEEIRERSAVAAREAGALMVLPA